MRYLYKASASFAGNLDPTSTFRLFRVVIGIALNILNGSKCAGYYSILGLPWRISGGLYQFFESTTVSASASFGG